MIGLALACIRIEPAKKGLMKKTASKVIVEPPAEFDKAWERDGVEEKPPGGVGKRAWWLRQILSRTPPQALLADHALSPAEFLAGVDETDYAKDVILALTDSCAASGEPEWCAAVLAHRLDRKSSHVIDLAPLWRALSPDKREAMLPAILGHEKLSWFRAVGHPRVLRSRVVLAVLDQGVRAADRQGAEKARRLVPDRPPRLTRSPATCTPVRAAAFEEAIAAAFMGQMTPSITKSLDRVRLRADLQKEFTT